MVSVVSSRVTVARAGRPEVVEGAPSGAARIIASYAHDGVIVSLPPAARSATGLSLRLALVTRDGQSRHMTNVIEVLSMRWIGGSRVTRELERLTRLLRLAEMRRDLLAITVVQSRVGRFTYAALEGMAARG